MDTVEVAIDFLPRRSHQLIATPITPRLPPRSVVPACRFARAPRSSARFSFYRSARFISSSRHLVLLSCRFYRHPVVDCPIHGGEGSGNGRWQRAVFFSRAPFPPAHYHSPRHQALPIGIASDRPVPAVGLGIGSSSSHPLGLSHSFSLVPSLPHLITERRRWCLSSFKQATTAWRSLGSSSHLIISSHPRHGASRPSSRLMRLVGRLALYTGSSTSRRGERSKQTNTKERGGTGTRNRGAGLGEERNENGNTTGTGRWQHKNGKQARTTEICDAIMSKNKTPLILFRPTPSLRVLSNLRTSNKSPAPGAWDERTAIS